MRRLAALALAGMASAALAQAIPPGAVPPDPGHVTYILPQDLKWQTGNGQASAPLFGDPAKPGPYGVAVKWFAGHMSRPHFHSTDRWAYVAKGTWWVSTSDTYDPAKTYPLPEGSFVKDIANTVHWDGAKDSDVTIIIFGIGPMTSGSPRG